TIALGSRMQRRTLLQWAASCAAVLPFQRLRLMAQPRELTPSAIATLHEISTTVLPASLGADRVRGTVHKFVQGTRGYSDGVTMTQGSGHRRLQKTGASPVPGYVSQLAAIDADARARGGRFATLDLETRRALLDAALTKANVRNLPPRPIGQHVVADLMAFYFRSSEANDHSSTPMIQPQACPPLPLTLTPP